MKVRTAASVLALSMLAVACAKPKPAVPGQDGGPGATAEAAPSSSGGSYGAPGGVVAQRPLSAQFAEAAGDRVFFALDEHRLNDEARATLSAQAAFLNRNPGVRVLIEGNADERGTREYNFALGARRANAARDHLVGLGVAPGRIETISYGKERPIDTRPNEDGWARNRNAGTVLIEAGGR